MTPTRAVLRPVVVMPPTDLLPVDVGASVPAPDRPWWVWWWRCPICHLASVPVSTPGEVTYLATAHDHIHHGGARTAYIRAVPDPTSTTHPEEPR
jgi:hypothetical protein